MFASFSIEYALKKKDPHHLASQTQSFLGSTTISFQKSQLKSILLKNTQSLHNISYPLKFTQIEQKNTISSTHFEPSQMTICLNQNIKRKKKQIDEKVLIKSEWRQLQNCQIFQDYLFLRDAQAMKELKLLIFEESEDDQEQQDQIFMNEEQERQYNEQQRKIHLEKVKEILANPNFQKSTSVHSNKPKKTISINILKDALRMIDSIGFKILTQELETVFPLSENLVKLFSDSGVVNFYLISVYLHSLIIQIYGRRVSSYQNWKRFLKICNQNGRQYYKYKLVGYKHISKCCIDLGQFEKALIYQKKMLKLSWVINDRNFEVLSYDMIALVLYYLRDIKRAMFFHEKFVKGDYEDIGSNVRNLGAQSYNLQQQIRERILDQNSFSDDDFDLEVIIHQSNLLSWQREQKEREEEKGKQKVQVLKKAGISFAKSDFRDKKESKMKIKLQKMQINQYKKKAQVTLGPIFKKSMDADDKKIIINKVSDNINDRVPVLLNQQSTNRVLNVYMLQREQRQQKFYMHQQENEVNYKPYEAVIQLKRLLKLFQYDIRFYIEKNYLFMDANTDL